MSTHERHTHEKATYEKGTRTSIHCNCKDSMDVCWSAAKADTAYTGATEWNRPYLVRYVILSACLISAICIGSIFIVKASERSTKSLNKYYTSVVVQEDDTLWDIADQYSGGAEDRTSYISSVKKLNNMSTDTLYKGQNLVVYYYSEEVK